MREDCSTCKNDWSGNQLCNECYVGSPPSNWEPNEYYEPYTNGDRIRNMNDEELADFLLKLVYSQDTPWSIPFAKKFCENCPTVEATIVETGKIMKFNECDFDDGKCPQCFLFVRRKEGIIL